MNQATRIIISGVLGMWRLLNRPTFSWNGETFNCVPDTMKDTVKSTERFFTENGGVKLTVLMNQFTPNIYPDKNDHVTYLGYDLIIKDIEKPNHQVFWVYTCQIPEINA